MNDDRVNLFGLDREGLTAYFAEQGQSAFRAKQVMRLWPRRHRLP